MAPTFEEMMDSVTKPKPISSADSNDTEGSNATKSRPSSPAASDHSVGLNDTEFQAFVHSLDETTVPACDKRVPVSKLNPSGLSANQARIAGVWGRGR